MRWPTSQGHLHPQSELSLLQTPQSHPVQRPPPRKVRISNILLIPLSHREFFKIQLNASVEIFSSTGAYSSNQLVYLSNIRTGRVNSRIRAVSTIIHLYVPSPLLALSFSHKSLSSATQHPLCMLKSYSIHKFASLSLLRSSESPVPSPALPAEAINAPVFVPKLVKPGSPNFATDPSLAPSTFPP